MSDEQLRSDPAAADPHLELLAAVREIERLLREMVRLLETSGHVASTPPASPRVPAAGPEWRRSLTPREEDILALLLTGMSNRAIARRLGITERTVKNNLHTVYRKLGVTGRAETIARFLPAAPNCGAADDGSVAAGDAAVDPGEAY